MAGLIDGAKRKIWSIANTIVDTNPDADIAMALVAYRDIGDSYVVKTTAPLSEDIQGLYGKLTKLEADGGGDTPESVNAALSEAVSKLEWSSGDDVTRIVFLVGDAPPHMDYQEKKFPAILEDAVKRDIIVNAVQAGNMLETTEIWREIAQRGHGRYMAIPQDGGEVVVIITPFDEEILELQRQLDKTVIPYGEKRVQNEIMDKLGERAAASVSTQADNAEYYSKRAKKEVVTGAGDLVADVRNSKASVSAIPQAELPEEMKAMKPEDRQVFVEKRLDERVKLEGRMTDLVAKRNDFIAKEKSSQPKGKTADSFDNAVQETLRSQLK
jgi:hypothetical protein